MRLADGDRKWKEHSGDYMHEGREWGPGDVTRAWDFYTSLGPNAKLILDLLIDNLGEVIDADQIADHIREHQPAGSRTPDRKTIASSLSHIKPAWKRSCRRLPFDWWRGAGGASTYAAKPAVAMLFREARKAGSGAAMASHRGDDWSAAEVRVTVDDYLAMLTAETSGHGYSKAEHRKALMHKLRQGRTNSAVEYKHQNISAAMLALGLPYIRGYKPRTNYQEALTTEIQRQLEAHPALLAALRAETADRALTGPLLRCDPPPPALERRRASGSGTGRHVDYGVLHDRNTRLGAAGEKLVVEYEKTRLRQLGLPLLAAEVERAADHDGDGLGYDVRSCDATGKIRYIEVKTTSLGAETPFYISSAELDFSRRYPDSYALYRVYLTPDGPRFFILEGDITAGLQLTAVTYRAVVAPAAKADADHAG